MRRDKGGGQSQMQGAQEEDAFSPDPIAFLSRQYQAGPDTHKADSTANTTRQHLTQPPDLRDISLFLSPSSSVSVSLSVCEI